MTDNQILQRAHRQETTDTDLLLVVDMQNVYTKGQAWACRNMENTVSSILRLLQSPVCPNVIFTRYLAPVEPKGTWKTYNEINAAVNADPHANAMMPEFEPFLRRYPLYTKSVYSSFAVPEVKNAAQKAGRVLLSGVVAECCILSTLLAGIDEGCKMIYLKDAVSGITAASEQETQNIISCFAPLHAQIMTVDEYIAAAPGQSPAAFEPSAQ